VMGVVSIQALAAGRGCVDCHLKYREMPAHAPFVGDNCKICHGAHASESPKPGDKVDTRSCVNDGCHIKKNQQRPDVMAHEPFKFGWCTMCHEHMVAFRKPTAETQVALCLNCHDKSVVPTGVKGQSPAAALSTHPPKGSGTIPCAFCHHHHEASKFFDEGRVPNPKRLIKPERQLCQPCHKDKTAHHIAPSSRQIEAKSQKAREIRCTFCHEAHFSKFEHLLREDLPKAKLCSKCHVQ